MILTNRIEHWYQISFNILYYNITCNRYIYILIPSLYLQILLISELSSDKVTWFMFIDLYNKENKKI